MGHQIIKQPDGRWAVWSSGVDDFVILDATAEWLENHYGELAAEDARASIRRIIEELEAGRRPYFQFTMTYDEAMASRAADALEEAAEP